MKVTQKWKNFWQIQKHTTGGFTLVELIVVIAILAILAGIAVPAYNGYIAKANEAADQQLLAAINTAFAAACAEEGVNPYGLSTKDADMPLIGEAGAKKVDLDNVVPAEVKDAFETFFAGNEDSAFKVYEDLYYSNLIGGFSNNVTRAYAFGDGTIYLSAKDVAILSGDNAFSDRGSDALLYDIGVLETYLAGGYIGGDILEEIGKSDDFFFALGGYLGLKQEDYDDSNAYKEAVGTKLESLDNENASTNALIMYAASNAANASEEQISNLFTGTVTSNIEVKNEDGTRNNEATMANAALAYGMYTAYLQQNPNVDSATNEGSFTKVVNSPAFAAYFISPEGQADLEAYMAAMNMVSDNTSNSKITSDILENGIVNNSDLAELMKDVMGN